jgi:hypothetical protein
MTAVSVLYFSGSGHTIEMAEAVAKGAVASGAKVSLLPIVGEETSVRLKRKGRIYPLLIATTVLTLLYGLSWHDRAAGRPDRVRRSDRN